VVFKVLILKSDEILLFANIIGGLDSPFNQDKLGRVMK
jgi:hypothetical protein